MEPPAAKGRRSLRKPRPKERLAELATVSAIIGALGRSTPVASTVERPASPLLESSTSDFDLKRVRIKVGSSRSTVVERLSGVDDDGKPAVTSSQRIIRIKGDHLQDASGSCHFRDYKEIAESLDGNKYNQRAVVSDEPVRKSARASRRRVLDGDSEDELQCHKKPRISKAGMCQSRPYEDEDVTSPRSGDRGKKLFLGNGADIMEEDEVGCSAGGVKREHQKAKSLSDIRTEPFITTRNRGKAIGDSFLEFPDGLPLDGSRRQKRKSSEIEMQAKKAEAAQKRKLLVQKAAKEAEEEAIRKILGVDSEKKKEEKKQKERQMKEKAAKAQIYLGSTVKWVMGPNGTVVTFPDDIGLPSLFDTKTCSYPPPREKCAGPSCKNTYKYRDSKSKLPLCSLECYRAVQGSSTLPLTC